MVMRRLKGIFGGGSSGGASGEAAAPTRPLIPPDESQKIGTKQDPLHGYEAALERNTEAQKAEERGDVEKAAGLYERSISEGFVGAHPYERLAALYESRHDPAAALRVTEAYIALAKGGTMPRGAQSSADRRLPEFETRAKRYRRALGG